MFAAGAGLGFLAGMLAPPGERRGKASSARGSEESSKGFEAHGGQRREQADYEK